MRDVSWALLGQHFLTELPVCGAGVFKVSCIKHFLHQVQPISRPQIHLKVFSVHDAIHFERFYRLHSCSAVTDNFGRQCPRGRRIHITHCWTESGPECQSNGISYMVCGEEENPGAMCHHRSLTAGITGPSRILQLLLVTLT